MNQRPLREPYLALPIDGIYWELYHELKHLGYENQIESIISSVVNLICFYSEHNPDIIMNDIEGIMDGFYHDHEEDVSLKIESIIFNVYTKLNEVFKNFQLRSDMFQDEYGECYYSRYQYHGLAGSMLILYDYVQYIKQQDNYEDIFKHIQ